MSRVYTCNGCGERVYWETVLDLDDRRGQRKVLLEAQSHHQHRCKPFQSQVRVYTEEEKLEFQRKRQSGEI